MPVQFKTTLDNPREGDAFNADRIKLLLFDLDGTLVDSLRDLAWCGNEMLRRMGLPKRNAQASRSWVGNGVDRFVKRFLTGDMHAEPEPAQFRTAIDLFNQLYAENVSLRSRVYPGVVSGLQRLSALDLHLACVTNKPEPFTSELILAMDLDRYFELVVAGNTTSRKKPDPMPLQYAAKHFGLATDACLMIGDSSNDVVAARAAGFGIICVPYGYNHGIDILESNPDLVVAGLTELAELFT